MFNIKFILFLLFIILLVFAVIHLQKKLSAMPNKFFGLILPLTSAIISLLVIFGQVFYDSTDLLQTGLQSIILLFLWNIPTMLLLAIYSLKRNAMKTKNEIEKMRKQDL